jgi:uncharacterized protein with HEPN domain
MINCIQTLKKIQNYLKDETFRSFCSEEIEILKELKEKEDSFDNWNGYRNKAIKFYKSVQ